MFEILRLWPYQGIPRSNRWFTVHRNIESNERKVTRIGHLDLQTRQFGSLANFRQPRIVAIPEVVGRLVWLPCIISSCRNASALTYAL